MEDAVALLERIDSPASDRIVDWYPSEVRRVVVRLVDGETVQVGTAANRDGAMALARSVIRELEERSGDWPLFGDRVVRPDAIVSVDVVTIG